jgi:hypothetical protein
VKSSDAGLQEYVNSTKKKVVILLIDKFWVVQHNYKLFTMQEANLLMYRSALKQRNAQEAVMGNTVLLLNVAIYSTIL